MTSLAGIVVVACGVAFIVLTGIIFAKPALAERFLLSFASSARAHYLEMAIRLLVGTAIVMRSPAMWQANIFRLFGWVIIISTVALLLLPWRWHHAFAQKVLPPLAKLMKVYAVGVFAVGCLLLYGVFGGGSPGTP